MNNMIKNILNFVEEILLMILFLKRNNFENWLINRVNYSMYIMCVQVQLDVDVVLMFG